MLVALLMEDYRTDAALPLLMETSLSELSKMEDQMATACFTTKIQFLRQTIIVNMRLLNTMETSFKGREKGKVR